MKPGRDSHLAEAEVRDDPRFTSREEDISYIPAQFGQWSIRQQCRQVYFDGNQSPKPSDMRNQICPRSPIEEFGPPNQTIYSKSLMGCPKKIASKVQHEGPCPLFGGGHIWRLNKDLDSFGFLTNCHERCTSGWIVFFSNYHIHQSTQPCHNVSI